MTKPEKVSRILDLIATLFLALFFGYAFWFLTALSFKIDPPNIYGFLFVSEFSTTAIFFLSYWLSDYLTRKFAFLKSKLIIATSLFGVNFTFISMGFLKSFFFENPIYYPPIDLLLAFDFLFWSIVSVLVGTLVWVFLLLAKSIFVSKLP